MESIEVQESIVDSYVIKFDFSSIPSKYGADSISEVYSLSQAIHLIRKRQPYQSKALKALTMANFRLGPLHNIPANRRTPYVQADGIVTPHGYLRIVELVLGIAAVILISCWHLDVDYTCRSENQTVYGNTDTITSFTLSSVQLHSCDGLNRTLWHQNDNAGKRFVFFNLISSIELVVSSLIVLIYLLFWGQYCRNEILPLSYIATSSLMTIIFLICTVIWWSAIADILTATSQSYIESLLTENAGFWDYNREHMNLDVKSNSWMLVLSGMYPFCAFVLNLLSSGFLFGHLMERINPT